MRPIDADALRKNAQHAKDISKWDGELLVVGLGHILNAPTISPRPDWTPCAEGMPEDLPEFQPMSRYECTILIPDGTREVFALHRTGNGRWLYETGKGLDAVHGDQVVAWRKVSAPYNPDRKEDAKSDDVSQWPDWKKRAALCNYEFGKED